ncbi:hypothetical protein D7V88_24110 [Corallococcus terminator]|uniref:Uncharacterized protein n=1 Tax=Corallococcus terminator TaxID=2316733 RepID=A0A3A8IJ18_9BACT|nr:hypothetical protein D7V88_24110 [Corallococcus terminator]
MVELGFTGYFDVIVDFRSDSEKAENKVKVLLPGFSKWSASLDYSHAGTFLFQGCKTLCRKLRSDMGTVEPALDFGITGGIDIEKGRNDVSPDELNVANLIKLQPYKWGEPILVHVGARKIDVAATYKHLHIAKRTFYLSLPDDSSIEPFAKTAPFNAVSEICKATQAGTINLCTAYGVHTWTDPVQVLSNLSLGILCAQQESAPGGMALISAATLEARLQRPAVLVALGNLDDEKLKEKNRLKASPTMNLLQKYLVESAPYSNSVIVRAHENFKSFLGTRKVAERVKVLRRESWEGNPQEITTAINSLGAKQLLIVEMGELPIPLFNYLYRAANLPVVFEGQNTAELVLNMGKPYFQLKHPDAFPPLDIGADFNGTMRQYGMLCSAEGLMSDHWFDWKSEGVKRPPEKLGQFIRDCFGGTSNPTSQYFQDLRDTFHKEEIGKLEIVLRLFEAERKYGEDWQQKVAPMEKQRILRQFA